MPLPFNSERGEVPLEIGGVEIVIAAEMEKLAMVSARIKSQTFGELYTKLVGAEPGAVLAAIELLTVRGDWGAALNAVKLPHLNACRTAFVAALMHHVPEDNRGNADAAKTNEMMASSLGGNGSGSPSAI